MEGEERLSEMGGRGGTGVVIQVVWVVFVFFFNDTATTEIYTLSLHDALPIWPKGMAMVKAEVAKLVMTLKTAVKIAPINIHKRSQIGRAHV
mgnify:CR=1 FL=1